MQLKVYLNLQTETEYVNKMCDALYAASKAVRDGLSFQKFYNANKKVLSAISSIAKYSVGASAVFELKHACTTIMSTNYIEVKNLHKDLATKDRIYQNHSVLLDRGVEIFVRGLDDASKDNCKLTILDVPEGIVTLPECDLKSITKMSELRMKNGDMLLGEFKYTYPDSNDEC